MYFTEKISKRVTCKKRYKIEKKVREHHKKLKKLAKKNNTQKPKPKDPGIPNSLPFKDEVIREAIEAKRVEDERKELLREEFRKNQRKGRDSKLDQMRGIDTGSGDNKKDLASLAKDAQKRTKEFDKKAPTAGGRSGNSLAGVSNLSSYYKEFQKVVESADIILQVVDARDPLGTRCPEVEEAVMAAGTDKKLVIVMNKVDLIPRDNLQNWLRYLRNEFPTVAFKASTQTQKDHLGRSSKSILSSSDDLLSSSKCLGANMLMKLLGSYCRSQGIKTAIRVGVVGFPNVGKSSVINSLKRSRACSVGSTPGLTKTVQEVSLDKHIKLIDSPGIVFAKLNQFGDSSSGDAGSARLIASLMALRNATKVETLQDPITPVEAILSRVRKEDLMLFYRLPDFASSDEFLELLAKRFGKLKRGGVADTFTAARKILTDWNTGKIKYFTAPPETHTLPTHISAEIVSSLSAGFKFDKSLQEEEMNEIDAFVTSNVNANSALCFPSLGMLSMDREMADIAEKDGSASRAEEDDDISGDECEEMAVDDAKSIISDATYIQLQPRKSARLEAKGKDVEMKDASGLVRGMQLNKEKRMQFKKQQKQKKRQTKVSEKLSSALDANVVLEDYSFDTDFV